MHLDKLFTMRPDRDCLPDAAMPYPRLCAHRGYNTVAPENTMPAFCAAVALGAEEIEFDLWYTADGHIVSMHDGNLDRVSDGTGFVYEKTYDELCRYDFGAKFDEKFRGMKMLTFEEILSVFARKVVMNIHIKTVNNQSAWKEKDLKTLIGLIDKYDCRDCVYFMTGNHVLMQQLIDLAPDITRCMGGGDAPWQIVERAVRFGCKKVQLFKPYFDQAMIDRAHEQGILCNVFWSDDAAEAKRFREMGIDVILTNDYLPIKEALE